MSKKKKKWSTTKKVVLSLLAVLVILVGTVLGFYQHVKNKIYIEKEPSISKSDTEFQEVKGITNVLLIGVDARDLDEPCRSDSMIIATIDNNNKKVKLQLKHTFHLEVVIWFQAPISISADHDLLKIWL